MSTETMETFTTASTVVAIPGPAFDAGAAHTFKDAMRDEFSRGGHYVFDFSAVTFISTSGIGAVLSCLRWLTAAGGDLRVCGLCPPVRHSFTLVRLHQVFEFYDDVPGATRGWPG